MRIAHTADLHSDSDPEKQLKFKQSMDSIIRSIGNGHVDVTVISGDIFERRQSLNDQSGVIPAKEAVMKLAKVTPVIIILGNYSHDNSGCLEIFRDLDTHFPIYVTESAETILYCESAEFGYGQKLFIPYGKSSSFDKSQCKAIFHLFSYPEKSHFLAGKEGQSIDISNLDIQGEIRKLFLGFGAINAEIKAQNPGVVTVFVGHCNILGSVLESGQTLTGQEIMIDKNDFAMTGADVVCLGHIHKAQNFEPNIFYSGSIYHKNFGEVSERSFYIHSVIGGGVTTERIPIPGRALSLHECHFQEGIIIKDNDNLDYIDAELRIRCYITNEQRKQVTDEMLSAVFPGAFSYKVEFITIPDERVRSEQISKAKTLREKVIEYGRVTEKPIPEEVLQKADEVERENQ